VPILSPEGGAKMQKKDWKGSVSRKGTLIWDSKENGTYHQVRIGRNDPCPCGSGKKYKFCCGIKSA